jgi:hypothetical protein
VTDLDTIIRFLEERHASSRLEAIRDETQPEHKLLTSGECVGYARTLEFVRELKLSAKEGAE